MTCMVSFGWSLEELGLRSWSFSPYWTWSLSSGQFHFFLFFSISQPDSHWPDDKWPFLLWASLNLISELFFCWSVISRFIFHWLAPNVNILLLSFLLRCTRQSAAWHVCSKKKEHKEGLWLLYAKTDTSFLNGDLPIPVKTVTLPSPGTQPLLGLSPSLPLPVPWF